MNTPDRLEREAAEAKAAFVATAREWKDRTAKAVNPTPWVRQNPWLAVGAAVVAGLAAGAVVPAAASSAKRARRVRAIHRRAAQLHGGGADGSAWSALANSGIWEKAFSAVMEIARLATTGFLAKTAHSTAETANSAAETAADAAAESNQPTSPGATATQATVTQATTSSFHGQSQAARVGDVEPLEARID